MAVDKDMGPQLECVHPERTRAFIRGQRALLANVGLQGNKIAGLDVVESAPELCDGLRRIRGGR